VLRAKLLTGSRAQYLREALGPDAEETSTASEQVLWWPPSKVAAPYLTGYLQGLQKRTQARQPASNAQADPATGLQTIGE
jgi:hypothetical protein